MVYYLYRVMTQSDLGENQSSIQPTEYNKLTEYNFLSYTKKSQNVISKIFHF